MTSRTGVLAGLAGSAVLALIASAQPWWRASGDGAVVRFSGADVTGNLTQALAAVLLAGALLALVLRAAGRRVLAVLLGLAAGGMVLVGLLRFPPGTEAVRTRLRQVSLVEQFGVEPTPWPWVYAAAGGAALVASVLVWRGAGRWSERSSRFQRTTATAPPDVDAAGDPASAWRALDAGLDPTDTLDPDVRSTAGGDTMDERHTTRGSSRSPE